MASAEIVQTDIPGGGTGSALKLSEMTGNAYRIAGLPYDNVEYAFSVWMKAEAETVITLSVLGTVGSTTIGTEWRKITAVTRSASSGNIDIMPEADTAVYLYKGKLETGNKATDWTPAPEDVDASVSDVQAGVDANAENISGLAAWKSEAELRLTDSAIVASVRQSAEYQQDQQNTADRMTELENAVSEQSAELAVLPGQIQGKVSRDELEKYFDFTAEDGLVIGEGGSTLKTIIAPAEMRFEENGRPVLILKESRAILADAEISGSMILGGVYMRYNPDTGHFSILRA